VGVTRHGLDFFYLQDKKNVETVPRKALIEAIELIDEAYKEKEVYSKYIYEMIEQIHPMIKLADNKLMIVAADGSGIHLTGLYTHIKDEPISVSEAGDFFYRGIGYYSNFLGVFYPRESLREPTEEEIEKWK
jgi:hypothetical protein